MDNALCHKLFWPLLKVWLLVSGIRDKDVKVMSYTVWESHGQSYVLYSVRKSRSMLCLIQCEKVKAKIMSYTVWESQGQSYVLYSVRKSMSKLCLVQCEKVKVNVMSYTVWESQGQSYVLYSVRKSRSKLCLIQSQKVKVKVSDEMFNVISDLGKGQEKNYWNKRSILDIPGMWVKGSH